MADNLLKLDMQFFADGEEFEDEDDGSDIFEGLDLEEFDDKEGDMLGLGEEIPPDVSGAPALDNDQIGEVEGGGATGEQTEAALQLLGQGGLTAQEGAMGQEDLLNAQAGTMAQGGLGAGANNIFMNDEATAVLETLASEAGLGVNDFITLIKDKQKNKEADEEIGQLVESGVDEALARELVELRKKDKEYSETLRIAETEKGEKQKYLDFMKEYPEVRELPPTVAKDIEGGENPLSAYRKFENEQLKAELAALKQNGANSNKSIGTVRGDSKVAPKDDFLEGLFGAE